MQKVMFLMVMAVLCLQLNAQVEITGKITDESNQPLIGASVFERGTSNGTVTDVDGKFSLMVKDSAATLVINYTGFESQEIKLKKKQNNLDIKLSAGVQLDEIVVIGYGKQKKKNSTAARSRTSPKRRKSQAAKKRENISVRGSRSATAHMKTNTTTPQTRSIEPTHNTEDYDQINENRFYQVQNEPQSTFSIDVDAASYSNMRRFLNNGQLPPKDAVRIEEMINYFDYDYPTPKSDQPFEVITEVSDCPWASEHRLLHIGLQGQKIDMEDLPPSNIVFLIDVSGSMSYENKLPLLKSSFELLVNELRPEDRVAIVTYAGSSGLVLPSTKGNEKDKMLQAINNLRSGGGTAGARGIKLAYQIAQENFLKDGNNRVILATDGDFNIGQSSDAELVELIEEKRESGVFLTVLGYGMGNYKDNKMQKLANKGNGNHAYIDNLMEANKVLVSEFGGTMFTIAKDVKIQIEFNPNKVAGYRLIGYENRLLDNEDFEDDTKDAGELGAGHTVTALYEIIPTSIKSEYLKGKSQLKYQETTVKESSKDATEIATVALRYKAPKGTTSKLIEQKVKDSNNALANTSNNFRFSIAVAEFGMLLRDSEFKGTANYEEAIELAKKSKGLDRKGYRSEMIELIERAKALSSKAVAKGN
ncbi:MAG: von Willebrand factor type A domain-containing protein [Bacteroidota bacterium]